MPHRPRKGALRASPSTLLHRRRRRHRHDPRAARHSGTAPPRNPDNRAAFPTPHATGRSVSLLALAAGMAAAPRLPAAAAPSPAGSAHSPRPAPSAAGALRPSDGQPMLPGLGLEAAPLPRPATDPRSALANYPDIPAGALCRHAKMLGRAAELLVDSLLVRLGERVFPVDEHEPFDRLLWLDGQPLRVQIKSRHRRLGALWPFEVRKGYQRAPEGTRPYGADEFDLLALVVLPEAVVKFVPAGGVRHSIHQREIAALRARPRDSLDAALRALGLETAIPRCGEAA